MNITASIIDMEASLNILLIGKEVEERDFCETPSGNGDDISYEVQHFTRICFVATGFAMTRYGCQIDGEFPQPIDAAMVEIADNGDVLESEYNDGQIARAALAKLGGIPDVEGGLRAAAGV